MVSFKKGRLTISINLKESVDPREELLYLVESINAVLAEALLSGEVKKIAHEAHRVVLFLSELIPEPTSIILDFDPEKNNG